jgi:hypothetical protein
MLATVSGMGTDSATRGFSHLAEPGRVASRRGRALDRGLEAPVPRAGRLIEMERPTAGELGRGVAGVAASRCALMSRAESRLQ